MVEAVELGKRYGAFDAVRNVSFRVERGEIVGLLGPNGAGKTTILRILTCYHFPSSGQATIAGTDVSAEPMSVKRRIGYLPENPPVYGDLTVSEYLDFIVDARRISRERRPAALERTVSLCAIGDVLDRRIDQLSKGYQQRVGLAQAIVHDPEILILDEPTTGLDPNQILEIRHLIQQLGSEKTVILSTHILQEVEAVCGRVLILNSGEIVASGTIAEIGRELRGEGVLAFEVVDGPEVDRALSEFGSLGEITSRARTQTDDGWAIRAAASTNVNGEDVYRWAVDHNLTLRSLGVERVTLEGIFTELTNQPGAQQ